MMNRYLEVLILQGSRSYEVNLLDRIHYQCNWLHFEWCLLNEHIRRVGLFHQEEAVRSLETSRWTFLGCPCWAIWSPPGGGQEISKDSTSSWETWSERPSQERDVLSFAEGWYNPGLHTQFLDRLTPTSSGGTEEKPPSMWVFRLSSVAIAKMELLFLKGPRWLAFW